MERNSQGEQEQGRQGLLVISHLGRHIIEEKCQSLHSGGGGVVSLGRETETHKPKMKTLRRNISK